MICLYAYFTHFVNMDYHIKPYMYVYIHVELADALHGSEQCDPVSYTHLTLPTILRV